MEDASSLEDIIKARGQGSPSKVIQYMSSLGKLSVFDPKGDQDTESVKSKSSSSTDSSFYRATDEQIAAVSTDMLRKAVSRSASKIVVHSSTPEKPEESGAKSLDKIRKSARSLEASFQAVENVNGPSPSTNGCEPGPSRSVQTGNESEANVAKKAKSKGKASAQLENDPEAEAALPVEKATPRTRKSTRLNSTEVASPNETAPKSSSDEDFQRPRRSVRKPTLNNSLPVTLPTSRRVSKKIIETSHPIPKQVALPSVTDSATPRRSTRTSVKPSNPPVPRVEPRPRRASTRHLSLNESIGPDASAVGSVVVKNASTKTPTRRSKRDPETPDKTPRASTRKKQKLSTTIDDSIMEEDENSKEEEGSFVKINTRKKVAGRKSRGLAKEASLNRERTPSPLFHLWPIVQP